MFPVPSKPGLAAELPTVVRAALERNATELLPLELVWTRTRTSPLPPLQALKAIKYPPLKVGELEPYKVRLIASPGKFYMHIWRSTPHLDFKDGQFVPDLSKPVEPLQDEMAYDGGVYYVGNSDDTSLRGGMPGVMSKTPRLKVVRETPTRSLFILDYLLHAGFQVPTTIEQIGKQPIRPIVLADVDSPGAGVAIVRDESNGSKLDVVDVQKGDRKIRYWLDPAQGYSVRRRTERKSDGMTVTDVECSDFVKIGRSDLWLPKNISVTWHTWDTIPDVVTPTPLIVEDYRLISFDPHEPAASSFVLNYQRPGTAVTDATVSGAEKFPDGSVSYFVPARPADLDQVIATAIGQRPPERRSLGGFLMIVNVIGLLAIGAAFAAKKVLDSRRKREKP